MQTRIEKYKTLLIHIRIAEKTQFHKEIVTRIASPVGRISGLAPVFATYQQATNKLDDAFAPQTKYMETEALVALDTKRDHTTAQLISRVDYHAKFPENDEERQAAHILQFITENYKSAARKDYLSETTYLRKMVEELQEQAAALSLFGLTTIVHRLATENKDFDTLYLIRSNKQGAKHDRGTLKTLAAKANHTFDIVCRVLDGLSLTPLDADTQSAIDEITHFLNSQIYQYTLVYHHHHSATTAKKNVSLPEKNAEI